MKLINLDPLVGIRQIVKGYFSVPRILPLELLLEKGVSPTLLGYCLICLVVADWDKSKLRNGVIRYEVKDLASGLNLRTSTLYSNLNKLKKIGFLKKDDNLFRIAGYQNYTSRGAQELSKVSLTSEKVLSLFPYLKRHSKKIESYLSKSSASFSNSFNGLSKSDLPEELRNKRKILLQNKSIRQ
jgi:predicted transcriptional regulator